MTKKISQLTNMNGAATIDRAADMFEVVDMSTNTSYRASPNFILGFSGGNPVSTSDSQSLTNKTFDNSNIFVIRDDRLTLQDNVDTTKQVQFQLSGLTTATTRVISLPNATTTLVGRDTTDTLTNKTLTSPTINNATIDNPVLQTDTVSEHTAANGVTVDGLNIKDGKLNTNNSVVTANVTDAAITPNKLVASTGTSWVMQSWVPTFTNFTLGNGVLTAKYVQMGKVVFWRLKVVLGTPSSMGSDAKFTPPVTLNTDAVNGPPVGHYVAYDVSATAYYQGALMESTANDGAFQFVGGGTTLAGWTSASPFTWTNGDVFQAQGWYEVA